MYLPTGALEIWCEWLFFSGSWEALIIILGVKGHSLGDLGGSAQRAKQQK